jgi:hypothetical protein
MLGTLTIRGPHFSSTLFADVDKFSKLLKNIIIFNIVDMDPVSGTHEFAIFSWHKYNPSNLCFKWTCFHFESITNNLRFCERNIVMFQL